MHLNAKMLYEAVKEQTPVTLLGACRPERTLRFPCFYDGEPEHLTAGGVYLVERDCLPHQTSGEQDVLWVTWSGDIPQTIPHCPVLIFREESRPERILNMLQMAFSQFALWKEQLWDILESSSSVKRMIEDSEPLFRHPLCVVDVSMNYLGYSASFMSKGRDIFFPKEEERTKMEGEQPAALFYDEEKDRIVHLSNRDFRLGTLYMLHTEVPFSETEEMLFSLLAEKLCQALQNLTMLTGVFRSSFKQQMEHYFQSGQAEAGQLYKYLGEWGGHQGDTFICYKVKASHINQKINAEYICSIFENALNAAIAFWNDGVLVVLVDVTLEGSQPACVHKKMEDVLSRLQLRAGVSVPFTELERAWYYFRQACCAFDEGCNGEEDGVLYFFQTYVTDYMLHHALGEFPRDLLLDKGLRRLIEHDKLYAVNYLDTLRAFFRCGTNMSQTADRLGIHRTSLNSRMQKIWECLGQQLTPKYMLYLQMMLVILEDEL